MTGRLHKLAQSSLKASSFFLLWLSFMSFWSEHKINHRAVSLSWHGFRILWSNTAADKMFTHCLGRDITGYSLIWWLSGFTNLHLNYICNFQFQSNQVIDMSEGNSQVVALQVKRSEGLQCWCVGWRDRWLNFDLSRGWSTSLPSIEFTVTMEKIKSNEPVYYL